MEIRDLSLYQMMHRNEFIRFTRYIIIAKIYNLYNIVLIPLLYWLFVLVLQSPLGKPYHIKYQTWANF